MYNHCVCDGIYRARSRQNGIRDAGSIQIASSQAADARVNDANASSAQASSQGTHISSTNSALFTSLDIRRLLLESGIDILSREVAVRICSSDDADGIE